MAFDSLTVAQLETMRDNLISAHAKALNAQSYGIGSRNLTRAQSDSILAQLDLISREIAARTDGTGGVGLVEFGEPA
jgi:BMFP domain-containing protein YqiC